MHLAAIFWVGNQGGRGGDGSHGAGSGGVRPGITAISYIGVWGLSPYEEVPATMAAEAPSLVVADTQWAAPVWS